MALPRLALTCGEPAGIGPDLCIAVAEAITAQALQFEVLCFADQDLLQARAIQLGKSWRPAATFKIHHHPLPHSVHAGQLDKRNARWVLDLLDLALESCRAGQTQALVTAPVQKSVINDAGIAFTGHTEYLAERCGDVHPVMMLVSGSLRVALATTHLPLASVSAAITGSLLDTVIQTLHQDLHQHWGIAAPRIGVCGLNPHAGESGHLGREEIDTITPAIARAQAKQIMVTGPWPADTIFTPRQLANFDAVLAMFHDQGLPVLKYAGFGKAVNVTLGLPIIRSSVDHGTALELAATGRADCGSLLAALALAAELAAGRGAT
jgi:4-hydroxythreonine-4-phosphate dehydrogenase